MLITLIAWQCCILGCFKLNNSWRELISNPLPICLEKRVCFCVIWKHSALIKNWNSKKKNTRVGEEISSALIKQFLPGIEVPDSSELEEAYIQVKMKAIQQVYLILCFCLFQRLFPCQMWSLSHVFKEWALEYLYCLIGTFKSNDLSCFIKLLWDNSTIVLIDAHLN